MKLYTLDKSVLMDVTSVKPHEQGVLIEGKIMGTMPMKTVLRPGELRAGFKFLSFGLVWTIVTMLFRKSGQSQKK